MRRGSGCLWIVDDGGERPMAGEGIAGVSTCAAVIDTKDEDGEEGGSLGLVVLSLGSIGTVWEESPVDASWE